MRLLKVQRVRSKDQQQEYKKFKKGASLCSSESWSLLLEDVVLQSGPFTASCRMGLLALEEPTENLGCFSRSIILSRTLSSSRLVAKVWGEYGVKLL